jgi:uncharacterized membrane protein
VTPGERTGTSAALAVAVSIAFALLAHFAVIDGLTPTVGALLSLLPVAILGLWATRRARHRELVLVGAGAAAIALWFGWGTLERNFPSLFFIEHAGSNLVLAIVFGRTLAGSREPLCTRFARLLHGTLPPEVMRYTRQVTVAWTVFFGTLFTLSSILYLGGFLTAWSLLANIASPILVGLMFVVEYAVRHRVLPEWERVGILGSIRAFSRHFATAPVEAPR